MNVACFFRRSTLERVIATTMRQALLANPIEDAAPSIVPGLENGFVAGVVIQRAAFLDQVVDAAEVRLGLSDRFYRNVDMIVDLTLYCSDIRAILDTASGRTPSLVPVGVRLPFLVSAREPTPDDMARSPSVLLLEASPNLRGRSVSVPGSMSLDWNSVFGDVSPSWFGVVTRALAKIEVGALSPPTSAAAASAIGGAGAAGSFFRPARVVGDEIHFGSIFWGVLPAHITARAIAAFVSLGPQLNDGEDCAVVLGQSADVTLFFAIERGIATYLRNNLDVILSSPGIRSAVGSLLRGVARFDDPPATEFLGDHNFRTAFPLTLFGACRGIDTSFPNEPIDLDLSIDAGTNLAVVGGISLNIALRINADFDQDDLFACGGLVTASELIWGAIAFSIIVNVIDSDLEWRITNEVVASPALQRQLTPLRATLVRTDTDSILIRTAVPVDLDAIGAYAYDPQTLRASSSGTSYRISGALLPFDTLGLGDLAGGSIEVRDVIRQFPLLFDASCSARLPSAIGFTLWNRSSRAVAITRFQIISEGWRLLADSGAIRWSPAIPRDRPLAIPAWGALRVRLEFASLELLEGALDLASSGAFAELVIVVQSTPLPIVVRWNDPLARLRMMTPTAIEVARTECRRGPISQPFEIHRRPPELELVPEIQPFWGPNIASGGGLPTPVNPQLQPWESDAPRPVLRLDANPGVFALLMQSVTQQK